MFFQKITAENNNLESLSLASDTGLAVRPAQTLILGKLISRDEHFFHMSLNNYYLHLSPNCPTCLCTRIGHRTHHSQYSEVLDYQQECL